MSLNGRSLQIARENVNLVVRTMNNLRAFSRMGHVQRKPVDLNALIDGSLALVAQEVRRFSIALVWKPGDISQVQGDPGQLSQMLLNLLNNALDALSEGGELVVETRMGNSDAGARRVEIRICDTGDGIATGDQGRIFEPFYTTRPERTGLGLSICKGILDVHGGGIEVESDPGAGTRVRVWLPVK